MDPPRFVQQYRGILTWLRVCGMPTPWLEHSDIISKYLFVIYGIFLAAMVSYVTICYAYTIMSTSMTFQDLCVFGISGGCYICGLLVTLYLLQFRIRLKKITDDIDSITKRIIESELGQKEFLEKEHYKNSKLMAVLTDCSLYLSFTTPIFYCVSTPVIEWYTGSYRSNLPLPTISFFDEKAPGLYELMVFFISYSIAISTSKKSANDCLFIALFKIQTIFLKYLSVSKVALEKELMTDDTYKGQRKLMAWVRLHQDIMKNVEELILYFSPVVIIYYVIVVEIVVCGAFVELKKDNDNIIQSISVGCYVATTILYYFLLSNTADELTDEAQKLAFVEYCLPWYKMKKNNISMVKIILTMCNKPIKITAYKAPAFLLNRETFAGFMISAISAFVTFCRMKETYG
nr:odorant receptor 43 [Graphosoma rubrolineatum]